MLRGIDLSCAITDQMLVFGAKPRGAGFASTELFTLTLLLEAADLSRYRCTRAQKYKIVSVNVGDNVIHIFQLTNIRQKKLISSFIKSTSRAMGRKLNLCFQ